MNARIRYSSLFLIPAALALGTWQGSPLRRTLTEGAVDTYAVNLSMKGSTSSAIFGDKDVAMKSKSTYRVKFDKVDAAKGLANIEVTETIDDLQADGIMGSFAKEKPAPVTSKGTLDTKNQMLLEKPTSQGVATLLLQTTVAASPATMFIALPDREVKVGDTWDIIVPKGIYTATGDQKLQATITGEKQVEGKDAWVVSVKGGFRMIIDSDNLPKPPNPDPNDALNSLHLLINGGVEINGDGLIEKTTGKTLSYTAKGNVRTEVKEPNLQLTMTNKTEFENVIALKAN